MQRIGMDIVRERLTRQHLLTRPWESGSAVVRALGAVQAQDYAGAKWALGQRSSGTTDASIEEEFTRGALLRTHVLRPTWHLVDPADIRWMLALTAPRVRAILSSYNRKLGLDDAVFRRSRAALEKALRDGRYQTRTELRAVLERAKVGPVAGQRLARIMMEAELDAVVCSGPRRGKLFTYALMDERAPMVAPLARDEALLRLTQVYFRSRGPATTHDFAWWSGLTVADVKRGIDIAGSALRRVTLNDRPHWLAGSASTRAARTAHLLPNYDEYFIGFRDRSAIAGRLGSVQAVTGGNALISHVVVVDGELVGGWRRSEERNRTLVSLDLRVALRESERTRIAAAARRLGSFVGLPVEVRGLV
jgi:hypothetical protein